MVVVQKPNSTVLSCATSSLHTSTTGRRGGRRATETAARCGVDGEVESSSEAPRRRRCGGDAFRRRGRGRRRGARHVQPGAVLALDKRQLGDEHLQHREHGREERRRAQHEEAARHVLHGRLRGPAARRPIVAPNKPPASTRSDKSGGPREETKQPAERRGARSSALRASRIAPSATRARRRSAVVPRVVAERRRPADDRSGPAGALTWSMRHGVSWCVMSS